MKYDSLHNIENTRIRDACIKVIGKEQIRDIYAQSKSDILRLYIPRIGVYCVAILAPFFFGIYLLVIHHMAPTQYSSLVSAYMNRRLSVEAVNRFLFLLIGFCSYVLCIYLSIRFVRIIMQSLKQIYVLTPTRLVRYKPMSKGVSSVLRSQCKEAHVRFRNGKRKGYIIMRDNIVHANGGSKNMRTNTSVQDTIVIYGMSDIVSLVEACRGYIKSSTTQ